MLEADWGERGREGEVKLEEQLIQDKDKIGILRSCWQNKCLAVFHMSNKKKQWPSIFFFFLPLLSNLIKGVVKQAAAYELRSGGPALTRPYIASLLDPRLISTLTPVCLLSLVGTLSS